MEEVKMKKDELVKLLEETSTAAATKAVEAKMKDLEKTNKFAFKGSFGDMTADEQAKLDKKSKIASFVKAVYHKDMGSLTAFKSLSEGTGSAGGFIVPEEFASEVNRVVEDFGLVQKLARIYPMKSDTLNVPRLASSVSVYWPGENTAGTVSQPVFEQVVLSAKSLVGITPMSNELLADANVSVVDLLVELFAEAIAGEMDKQGFVGTGSPFTGICTDAGVTVYSPTTTSTFTLSATPDNCRALITQIKPWALQGAAFFMHRNVWALIQVVKASSSGDYFISAYNPVVVGANTTQGFPNAMAGTLWGYPVYLSDKLPGTTAISTKYIVFGNLKHLYVGDRSDLVVAISQDASIGAVDLFASNMSAVRVVSRKAIAVGLPDAFAVLKTTAS